MKVKGGGGADSQKNWIYLQQMWSSAGLCYFSSLPLFFFPPCLLSSDRSFFFFSLTVWTSLLSLFGHTIFNSVGFISQLTGCHSDLGHVYLHITYINMCHSHVSKWRRKATNQLWYVPYLQIAFTPLIMRITNIVCVCVLPKIELYFAPCAFQSQINHFCFWNIETINALDI